MKIKKGDTVKILTGKDKGKTGKVLHVFAGSTKGPARLTIEGINLRYKHVRPKSEREKGQRIQFPYPLDASNASLVCPQCSKNIRVGYKLVKSQDTSVKEKKQRICRKCGAVI